MKWKLSTSAMLATVAGTWALTAIRADAQQLPAAGPATTAPATVAAPYDPVAVLNGTTAGVTSAQRDEAAQRLLSRHTAEARQILHDALVAPDELGQLAVARALGQDPNPDPSFVDPLFPLLDSERVAVAAGRALAGYKADPEVLTRLIDRATSRRNAAEFTRVAAIRAIGTMPEKRAASVLMQLLVSPDESPTIHKAAAEALTNLTGLDQNGFDAARWVKWWNIARIKTDAQFRTEIESMQDARLDRLDARYHGLVGAVEPLLREAYHNTKTPADRQDLMLTFLRSPEPEVRQIGTRLLSQDVIGGAALSPAELKQLRDMIADSDAGVRRSVADAISKINDPEALGALLNQLSVEPDPTVRAEIATALGPIHDLRAVDTLIKLLSDDSLQTAEAAARALEDLAHGPLPGDPKLSRKTAEALKQTILTRSQTAGSDDLRAACLDALAALQQTDIVHELLDDKLLNTRESVEVRVAMLGAIGALNDEKFVDPILASLDDPNPDVQRQAIEALSTIPNAAAYVDSVGKLLDPSPSRAKSVSDAAWTFIQGVFPSLSEQQLEQNWVERLKGDPNRQLLALEALAEKQVAAKELEDLATTRAQIGDAYMALKKWDKAAASYKVALDIYNGLNPPSNAQARIESLARNNMDAFLKEGLYPEATSLAADRITRDPSEQSTMGRAIANEVGRLVEKGTHDDLLAAQRLIDLASKMSPRLDPRYQEMLDSYAADIKKRSSSLDGFGPVPQSATVDGK